MKENERLKSDKSRKGYLYGSGAGASGAQGATGSSYAGKFNSSLFGQHLLKGTAQKENAGVTSSQIFSSGFSKYIGDGHNRDEKVDPTTLPMAVGTQPQVRGLLGSPNPASFLGMHSKTGSSGAVSFKSGSNIGKNEFGTTSSSNDETNS